eukprot:3730638-Pyramimonas_sp.AAC.1
MENHACEVRKRRAKVAPEKIASKKDKIVMKKRVTGKLRPVGTKRRRKYVGSRASSNIRVPLTTLLSVGRSE